MKDEKGHGSDPRGAHSEGVQKVGAGRTQWKRDRIGGYVHPNGWSIVPSMDRKGIWNVMNPDTGRVADSHKSLARMKQVYG